MFGFLKGKIELELSKTDYSPGETIKGKAKLSLKKPVKARRVKAELLGRQYRRRYGRGYSGGHWHKIYSLEKNLDGEKEYKNESYDFEITIPENILGDQSENKNSTLGNIVGTLNAINHATTHWYIEVSLDVPRGFNVNKKVQINLKP